MRRLILFLLLLFAAPAAAQKPKSSSAPPACSTAPRARRLAGARPGRPHRRRGPNLAAPADARVIDLPGATLMPGHDRGPRPPLPPPLQRDQWDDQVLQRAAGAAHRPRRRPCRATLMAGFTTVRDLGTEGAGYADVGLKQAIDQGIVPGPRLLVATRAIVATRRLWPEGCRARRRRPAGRRGGRRRRRDRPRRPRPDRRRRRLDQALCRLSLAARRADAGRPSPRPSSTPAVETARDAGRQVAVHATTAEGMRRADLAGADTIEHGYGGTPEVFRLMNGEGVALCPTLAASEADRPLSRMERPASRRPKASRRTAVLRHGARRPASRSAWAATSASSRTATTPARWS